MACGRLLSGPAIRPPPKPYILISARWFKTPSCSPRVSPAASCAVLKRGCQARPLQGKIRIKQEQLELFLLVYDLSGLGLQVRTGYRVHSFRACQTDAWVSELQGFGGLGLKARRSRLRTFARRLHTLDARLRKHKGPIRQNQRGPVSIGVGAERQRAGQTCSFVCVK